MRIRWEQGPAECRVCGWAGQAVLEVDIDDVATWDHVREHMECHHCRQWTVQFTGPRGAPGVDDIDPRLN